MAKIIPSKINKPQSLRVLMVEDSESDERLIIRELKKGGFEPEYERVETISAMKKALKEKQWDIILCDYKMPEFDAPSAIAVLKGTNIDIPLIIVSGAIGEETAVECMRSGAHDYIMKTNLPRLCPAIARELKDAEVRVQRKQTEESLWESEERFRILANATWEGLIIHREGTIMDANESAAKTLGYSLEEIIGKNIITFIAPESIEPVMQKLREGTTHDKLFLELEVLRKDKSIISVEAFGRPIRYKNIDARVLAFRDNTERNASEAMLRESEQRFMNVLYSSLDAVLLIDGNQFINCNEAAARMLGYTNRNELLKTHPSELSPPTQPDGRNSFEKAKEMIGAAIVKGFHQFEWEHRRASGEDFPAEVSLTSIVYHGKNVLHCLWRDLTESKRAKEENAKLEAQLLQAQKMESVGRLAGGVAHDFNNMLSVILGHTEMALEQMDPAQPLFSDLQEVKKAAERSADLTRQLLAFARKQVISPKVLDVNETIEGILKMLRRLIGENINLAWLPLKDQGQVNMDPSQIDQLLANLCVNARDAIEGVGRITIETQAIVFDQQYCADNVGFIPGEYLQIAFSDDGCGMDKETLAQIFEPFFTTKGVGKGTGLGLSTVYGIVKQNNGFINVYSEPGYGTTFKIYLPRYIGEVEQMKQVIPEAPAAHYNETILVVEDEPSVLILTTKILQRQGYTVLAAAMPDEAISLTNAHRDEIDLLLIDVIMPEMNGHDLAENLLPLCPNLKCLFMSGYTADVIANKGVLAKGVHFIQKPFSVKNLTAKVREVLAAG